MVPNVYLYHGITIIMVAWLVGSFPTKPPACLAKIGFPGYEGVVRIVREFSHTPSIMTEANFGDQKRRSTLVIKHP